MHKSAKFDVKGGWWSKTCSLCSGKKGAKSWTGGELQIYWGKKQAYLRIYLSLKHFSNYEIS